MKIKNLILVVFLILFVGFGFCQEENNTTVFFTHEAVSKYIIYGSVFLDRPFTSIGGGIILELFKGELLIYQYMGFGEDYIEGGLLGEYILPVGNLVFKTTVFPFVWAFSEEESDWGILAGEEVSVQTFLHPSIGYCYLWVSMAKEFQGHYFFVSLKERFLSIDWEAKLGYNKDFCVEKGQGFNAMLGLSKTIPLVKNLSTTLFLRFFLNDPDIGENETVFGITTTFAF